MFLFWTSFAVTLFWYLFGLCLSVIYLLVYILANIRCLIRSLKTVLSKQEIFLSILNKTNCDVLTPKKYSSIHLFETINIISHYSVLITCSKDFHFSYILHPANLASQSAKKSNRFLLSTKGGKKHWIFQCRRWEQGPEWVWLSLAILGLYSLLMK